MRKKAFSLVMAIFIISILVITNLSQEQATLRSESSINPDHIREFMQAQVDLGPRHPGSQGSLDFRNWIVNTIPEGWTIEMQNYSHNDVDLRNFWITSDTNQNWPSIILGAHYDTRRVATQDNDNPTEPVPGANDAASGVAGILEMLDHIPSSIIDDIGFVLFDGEDQGYDGDGYGMPGWDWIVGSNYFADEMTGDQINATDIFILLDMIADDDLVLEYERNSNEEYRTSVWDHAHSLGYDTIFKKREGYRLTDDHLPFIRAGIPAIDIIDFDYPEWHTTRDDMDHVSSENAAIVVDVVLDWLSTTFTTVINSTNQPSSLITPTSPTSTNDTPFYFPIMLIPLLILIRKSTSKP